MNKLAYISYSHREANRKIWNFLMNRYELLKKKNILLAYLWFSISCILFGFIDIFSWFSSLTLLFKDIRFTPHYMQTVIEHNNWSLKESNEYLHTQLAAYKKNLSYGNISSKERNSIDTAFEILFNKYKLPEIKDEKYTTVLSDLSEIRGSINNVSSQVESVQSIVVPISTYAENKRREEEEIKSKSANRRIEQNNMQNLGCTLDEEQLEILSECFNELRVFVELTNVERLSQIFACTIEAPICINRGKNKTLAFILNELSWKNYISLEWQSICTKNKIFVSFKGKVLEQTDYSSTLFDAKEYPPKETDTIYNYIKQMKKH